MRNLLILIAPTFLLFGAGCPLDSIGGGKTLKDYDRSPAGWPVEWKPAAVGSLHTKEEAYALFDAAMVRAAGEVEAEHGIPAAAVLDRARKGGVFILIDSDSFPAFGVIIDVPGYSGNATGEIDGGSNITVAFYSRGLVEVPGGQYPALWYELAHEWGY